MDQAGRIDPYEGFEKALKTKKKVEKTAVEKAVIEHKLKKKVLVQLKKMELAELRARATTRLGLFTGEEGKCAIRLLKIPLILVLIPVALLGALGACLWRSLCFNLSLA